MGPDKFKITIEWIDRLNGEDPRKENVEGMETPFELAYSKRLTQWVEKLEPEAPDTLRIAARGQHIGRWTVPRSSYPMNRGGYLRWREELKRFHSQKVGEIMRKAGYPEETVRKVQATIQKKNMSEPETQTIEDALCLEFLTTQFAELKSKTANDKMKDIVKKTWKKMSPKAQEMALNLELNQDEKKFIQETLQKF